MNAEQLCEHYHAVSKALREIKPLRQVQSDFFRAAQYQGDELERLEHLFNAWAGVRAETFAQQTSAQTIRQRLESSPAPATDEPATPVSLTAIDRADIDSGGEGLVLLYHLQPSPFGHCFVAFTEQGICQMSFIPAQQYASAVADLRQRWPRATLREAKGHETTAIQHFVQTLGHSGVPLALWVGGTEFQHKVWQTLLSVRVGDLTSYAGIAKAIGRPATTRAVANAVAANPIALVIPCHRVIHVNGKLGEYRWGAMRKMAMVGWEAIMKQRRALQL